MKATQPKQLFRKVIQPSRFEDFVKFANFFYATIGIQPYEESEPATNWQSLLTNLTFFVEFIIMNLVMSGEIAFSVVAFVTGTNFVEATMTMSYVAFVIVSNCKMLVVWQQKSALTRLVNGLKTIFPKNMEVQQDYNLQKYLQYCSHITLSFSVLYMILIWTYNLLGIVTYVIGDLLLGLEDVEQTLPFIVYVPWNWKKHWSYYFLYIAHDLAGYTSAAAQISSDLFLIACATQLIMHFDYLSKKITLFPCTGSMTEDVEFLQKTASYHATLLDLCEQLNDVFGVPLLLNLVSSAFVICFVGFEITIGSTPGTMAKLILFLISSVAQAYLICHFGQRLLDVSVNVASAVYNQEWFWSDTRYQKMLVLIAERAQKPAQLKATSFVHVSLDTMSELMQMSYKFFTLLRTMYGD